MSDDLDKPSNVIPFEQPDPDFSEYVTQQLDCSFDELLDLFRQNGGEVERFHISDDGKKTQIAND